MKKDKNNDHNIIPKENLPNPVSLDNDLHIKDDVFEEDELKKEKNETGVFKDEEGEVEDKVTPEQEIEDGTNPEHKVKDDVNEVDDGLFDSQGEKVDQEKEYNDAMYPDESGVPVV